MIFTGVLVLMFMAPETLSLKKKFSFKCHYYPVKVM